MASDLKVFLTLKVFDRMSAPIKRMVSTINKLKNSFTGMKTKALAAASAIKKFGQELAKSSAGQFAANMSLAGNNLNMIGGKMRAAFAGPIETFEAFEQKMAEVNAIMKPTTAEFAMLTDRAEELGFTIGEFTMLDVASGMKIMGMAGRNAAESLEAIPHVLNLSTAASLDLAETTDIVLGIMGGFSIQADETQRVTDVLAATFTGSKVDLQKLGETFKFVAATAGTVGVSFEETALLTGLLGNASLDASIAGTTLNQMMLKLVAPTPKAAAALKGFNVQIAHLTGPLKGKMRSQLDIMRDIGKAMAGMGDVEIGKNLKEIFGIRGFKGAARLMKELGSDAFVQLQWDIEKSTGRTKELAEVMRDTSANQTMQMTSAFDSLGKVLGEQISPALNLIKFGLKTAATWMAKLVQKFPITSTVVLIFLGVITLLVSVLGPLALGFSAVATVVSFVTVPSFLLAAGAVWAFLTPILLIAGTIAIFAVMAAAVVLMGFYFNETSDAVESFFRWLGLSDQAAATATDAVMIAFTAMVGPILTVIDAVAWLIDLMSSIDLEVLNNILGKGLNFLAPGLVDQSSIASEGSDIANKTSALGGELRIVLDKAGDFVKAEEVTGNKQLDIAVNVGRSILGFD